MTKSHIGSVALVGATLAGGLALLLIPAGLLWVTSLIGLILLLVLLSYDGDEKRSAFQSVAFSAVCGFCITIASLAVYAFALKGIAPEFAQLTRTWLPITYLCATIVVLLVDFARMSGRVGPDHPARVVPSLPTAPPVISGPTRIFPQEPQAPPAPVIFPPKPAAESLPDAAHQESIEPRLVRNAEPARPAPEPVPVKPGKETNIYVNLIGEGLNMLRSVRAEHLGRDYYRIIEPMPESEKWEYSSGQVVRCRKKNLSSGKALVAVEEAPRAN